MFELSVLLCFLVSLAAPFIVNLRAYRKWSKGYWIRVGGDLRWQKVTRMKYRTMLSHAYYPCEYEEYTK